MRADSRERIVDDVRLAILEREGRLRPLGSPATELEALMATAPGFEPAESYESRAAQMDELVNAMRCLTDEELFLVEAKFYEDLSFRQIGRRLGYGVKPNYGKSTAERKIKKAVLKLRRHLGVEASGWADDGRPVTVQDGCCFSETGGGDAGASRVSDPPVDGPVGEDVAFVGEGKGVEE